jgi:hypothetical protein
VLIWDRLLQKAWRIQYPSVGLPVEPQALRSDAGLLRIPTVLVGCQRSNAIEQHDTRLQLKRLAISPIWPLNRRSRSTNLPSLLVIPELCRSTEGRVARARITSCPTPSSPPSSDRRRTRGQPAGYPCGIPPPAAAPTFLRKLLPIGVGLQDGFSLSAAH